MLLCNPVRFPLLFFWHKLPLPHNLHKSTLIPCLSI
nr:MAG TPA: hypothetical protein [Caudoviricetes sp.]